MRQFVGYACLDIDHPPVAWATYRGVLVSAKAGIGPDMQPVSMMLAGIIRAQNNARLHNELIIEYVRASSFPYAVSRLGGMYFFETMDGALQATEWGSHFKPANIVELGIAPIRDVTRVDSNWITFARLEDGGRLDIANLDWIQQYWRGLPFPDKTPLWEILVEGRATIWGTDHRERAYELLRNEFPDCLDTLEIARIGAELESDLGHSRPWIRQISEDKYELGYLLDMRDATNPDFLKRLQEYKGPRNWKDLQIGVKETMGVPDFRPYGATFHVGRLGHPILPLAFPTLHVQNEG